MPSKSSPAFFGFTPATKQFLPLAYSRHMRVWNWPVLPVMPCVMTLVLRSMRMDMDLLGGDGLLLRRGDDFLGGIAHVVRGNDGKARVGEDLLAEVDVGALEAHDERHLEADLLRRRHAAG